jgi:type II secretory pathway component PulF
MTLLKAPAGSRQRALFYHQLASLLQAGLPLFSTLEQLARNPPAASLRTPALSILSGLKAGLTFTESFKTLSGWAPDFDVALIQSGEHSGRLDQTFAILARHHDALATNWQLVLQEAAYPVLVLHVAVFIVPLPLFVRTGSIPQYLLHSVGTLALGYAAVAATLWAVRPDRPRPWRSGIEQILVHVPILGSARSDLALARLAGSLEALLSAGILVTEAWPMAARASGSDVIEQTVASWDDPLSAGITPAELVQSCGVFPELFASAYATGEISGSLEEQLRRMARIHEEDGFRKLRAFSQWSPRIFYGLVSIWIVFQILALAGGYVSTLQQLLGE